VAAGSNLQPPFQYTAISSLLSTVKAAALLQDAGKQDELADLIP